MGIRSVQLWHSQAPTLGGGRGRYSCQITKIHGIFNMGLVRSHISCTLGKYLGLMQSYFGWAWGSSSEKLRLLGRDSVVTKSEGARV